MLSFCAVFNCSNRAGKEKDKSNYCLPSIVKKKVAKKTWNFQKWEKKKSGQLKFSGFNWEKARKNKKIIKIMLSASLSSVFSHQIHNIRFEKQIYILSLSGNWTWTDSVAVIHLNLKDLWPHWFWTQISFKKIKNWLSIGFELESPWLGTYFHNHYIMLNLQYDGES